MAAAGKKFRQTFTIAKEALNWYPGHMHNNLITMKARIKSIDCIIEVHDARVPFSGRNPVLFNNLVGTKPHILVLNKVDLINETQCSYVLDRLRENNINNVVYTNCLNQSCRGLRSILPLAMELIKTSSGRHLSEEIRYKVMVVGIPNVGKSSFINALRNIIMRKGAALAVGGVAGITRSVQNEIKICSDPPTYLIDTPGILTPNILDVECGMKLALCACLKDEVIGHIKIADFLLYWMNKTSNFMYVDEFDITEPVDKIVPLLMKIALDRNKTKKLKNIVKNKVELVPDVNFAAQLMVTYFRKGRFGDLYLDKEHF